MKLIIDIPDNEYKQNKHYYDSVYHGIPLDDVKAEIHKKMADYVARGYADSAEDFEEYSRIVNQAFDNIGKESEDKE